MYVFGIINTRQEEYNDLFIIFCINKDSEVYLVRGYCKVRGRGKTDIGKKRKQGINPVLLQRIYIGTKRRLQVSLMGLMME